MVWFLSEMKAARHQEMELVIGFPLSISLPQMLCRSTFRNSPLPSAVCLKVDGSAEQMLLRFCQQPSAQPHLGSWIMVSEKRGGDDGGVVLWSLYLSALCQKWWSTAIANSKLILALFERKEWVSLIYYLKIYRSRNQARLLL